MKRITTEEVRELFRAQGVAREHLAFKCPMCGTVQSMASLRAAGVAESDLLNVVGFSCEGRFTHRLPPPRDEAERKARTARGCNWTLGGLLRLHAMEVDGEPTFEPASPEEAQALAKAMAASEVLTEGKLATPEPSQGPPLPR